MCTVSGLELFVRDPCRHLRILFTCCQGIITLFFGVGWGASRAPASPSPRRALGNGTQCPHERECEFEFAFMFHVEQCTTRRRCYACAGRSGATLGCWPGAGLSTCCTSSLGGVAFGLTRAGSSLPSMSIWISLASSTSRSSSAWAIFSSEGPLVLRMLVADL